VWIWDQAATSGWLTAVCLMPSTYVAPAYTASSNFGALTYRKVVSATWRTLQLRAVAESTFLNHLAAVVRSRTASKGDSTTLVVRRWRQCSRGNR
jgi:hypothetical protein